MKVTRAIQMVKYSRSGDWDSQLIEEIETRAYRAELVAPPDFCGATGIYLYDDMRRSCLYE